MTRCARCRRHIEPTGPTRHALCEACERKALTNAFGREPSPEPSAPPVAVTQGSADRHQAAARLGSG